MNWTEFSRGVMSPPQHEQNDFLDSAKCIAFFAYDMKNRGTPRLLKFCSLSHYSDLTDFLRTARRRSGDPQTGQGSSLARVESLCPQALQ